MLRYLASGVRDLARHPILSMTRFNWEFYAVLRGELRPTGPGLEGEFFQEASLWLFPPEMPHGWESRKRVERIVLHFSSVPDVVREACAERGHLHAALEAEDVEHLRKIGRELESHYRAPTPTSLLLFDRALIDLSLCFLRERKFSASLPLETVAVERVERVVDWYLSHLHERPTLEALAAVVHVSTAHLRRQFHLVYGESPNYVLTHLRLERAAQALASTRDTLEAIARRTGFNSASDLCRVFKRRYKVYPNEWRTQIANTEDASAGLTRKIQRVESGQPRGLYRPRGGRQIR